MAATLVCFLLQITLLWIKRHLSNCLNEKMKRFKPGYISAASDAVNNATLWYCAENSFGVTDQVLLWLQWVVYCSCHYVAWKSMVVSYAAVHLRPVQTLPNFWQLIHCRHYQVAVGRPQWQLGLVFDSADTRRRHQLWAGQAAAYQYHSARTCVFYSWRHQVTWGELFLCAWWHRKTSLLAAVSQSSVTYFTR